MSRPPMTRTRGVAERPAVGRQIIGGAAGPSSGPAAIVAAYLQAHGCVEALLALGRCGEAATLSELGFLGMLLGNGAC